MVQKRTLIEMQIVMMEKVSSILLLLKIKRSILNLWKKILKRTKCKKWFSIRLVQNIKYLKSLKKKLLKIISQTAKFW
uniref:Uncharacterized protein n=1 Tax=Ciona intestinalis TaxID=7719 RepID=H2XQK2_CIOIN